MINMEENLTRYEMGKRARSVQQYNMRHQLHNKTTKDYVLDTLAVIGAVCIFAYCVYGQVVHSPIKQSFDPIRQTNGIEQVIK